jgi:hypothetical protein
MVRMTFSVRYDVEFLRIVLVLWCGSNFQSMSLVRATLYGTAEYMLCCTVCSHRTVAK